MAKKRRGRWKVRAPPKSQERALLQRAYALREDYSPLLPECGGSCNKAIFNRIERALSIVKRYAGDQGKLEKLASRGDPIARAYAGMLMIANSGRVPYTAAAPTPFGEAIYAVRGKVPKEVLIGVQHYDDRRLLLMAYMPMAMKKRLYFYATKEKLYCSGKKPSPPEDYVKEAIKKIPYNLKKDGDRFLCPHLIKNSSVPYLKIVWKSVNLDIMVCESCLSSDINTLGLIVEGIGAKNPLLDFEIDLYTELEAVADKENCPETEKKGMKRLLERYSGGKLSDRGFMERVMSSIRYSGGGRYLIIGRKCYGEDESAFIEALRPGRYHGIVEAFVRSREGPIVIEVASINKLLDYSWNRWGKKALEIIFGDESRAAVIWEEYRRAKRTPLEMIEEGIMMLDAEKKLEKLPEYLELPKTAEFCDSIARAYRIGGRDEAVRSIESWVTTDEHIKAIGYAFLSAMGVEKGREWQYSEIERDLGEVLRDMAAKLLEKEGEEYHESLIELLRYAGVSEKVVKK